MYFYHELYSYKEMFVRNRALGEAFNDLVFPASYKILDILEAVKNDERIYALECSNDLIESIENFEKNSIPQLTVNPDFSKEKFNSNICRHNVMFACFCI